LERSDSALAVVQERCLHPNRHPGCPMLLLVTQGFDHVDADRLGTEQSQPVRVLRRTVILLLGGWAW
jgi:hypothetical protein